MNPSKPTHILIFGDLILDQYHRGKATRISPEAPIPVLEVAETDNRCGGAANVARNAKALHCNVTLCGIIGQDDHGTILKSLLENDGIHPMLHAAKNHPTTTKIRAVEGFHQLMRMDFEQTSISIQEAFDKTQIDQAIDAADLVVFSDYQKGALSQVDDLISRCKQQGKTTLVDPKPKTKLMYHGASWVKPNLSEFTCLTQLAGLQSLPEAEAAQALCTQQNWQHLLITKGAEGMVHYRQDGRKETFTTQPATIYDVTGAGDTVTATLAMALSQQHSEQEAISLANLAGGLIVQEEGTSLLDHQKLLKSYAQSIKPKAAIDTIDALMPYLNATKQAGQNIVFTNGCFDLLHYGHVSYLKAAKALGDLLIVGLNSDASCKRLKGPARPFNQEKQRKKLLEELKHVDYVILFDEDTPQQLIDAIVPNILVKGGDYQPEEIVGYDTVTNAGGSVETLPFIEGFSSTKLAEKIKETKE